MKFITLLVSLISSVYAGTVSFIGPCSETPLATHAFEVSDRKSIGRLTIETLEQLGIAHQGNERGLNSIFDTPTGLDAMEVISDSEMLAYGWCYSVNGFGPAQYPHQVQVKEGDQIVWWFGYAHYKDGRWITQCSPSYERRSPQFCL